MKQVIYVTGNPEKAANFSKHMGASIPHESVELDEIQTLDAHELVEHKAKQAFKHLQQPVLVEDVTFDFTAMNGLPGPFIKYFVHALNGPENMCRMLKGFDDRSATARCVFGYYDGSAMEYFEGYITGVIAEYPRGTNGYGFDRVFEPVGFNGHTAAELDEDLYDQYYSTIKPFHLVREFLDS